MCGGGHAWQGGGGVWQGEVCMTGGVHGRGVHGSRHAWKGMCMAGGVNGMVCAWQGGAYVAGGMQGRGACMVGGMHGGNAWGACMAGETAIAAAGMHPTGMHSCLWLRFPLPMKIQPKLLVSEKTKLFLRNHGFGL